MSTPLNDIANPPQGNIREGEVAQPAHTEAAPLTPVSQKDPGDKKAK